MITLNSLPPEIIVRIVEQVNNIAIQETEAALEAEREEHFAQHHHHHHHGPVGPAGGPGPVPGGQAPEGGGGVGFAPVMFGAPGQPLDEEEPGDLEEPNGGAGGGGGAGQQQQQPQVNGAPNNANLFTNNLWGFLNGAPGGPGVPGANAGNVANQHIQQQQALAQILTVAPPPQAQVQPQPHPQPQPQANQPNPPNPNLPHLGVQDLFNLFTAGLGPLPGQHPNNNDEVSDDDDEIPELEPLTPPLPASNGPTMDIPASALQVPLPPSAVPTPNASSASATNPFASPQSAATVTIDEDSDQDNQPMPLNPHNQGFDPSSQAILEPIHQHPIPHFPPESPLSPHLAHELSMPQSLHALNLTDAEIDQVEYQSANPSPSYPLQFPPPPPGMHGHQIPEIQEPEENALGATEGNESDWVDTSSDEGHGEDEEDEEEEFLGDDEYDDEEDMFSEDDDALSAISSIDPKTFTYQDGLPIDPILPLAFINRSFLNAVRSQLYGRTVVLEDMYQASLFLRTIQSHAVSPFDPESEPDADDEEVRRRFSLPWLVRHVILDVRKTLSLGRSGGSVVIELLKSCKRMEKFICTSDWLKSAEGALIDALKSCPEMKAIALRGNNSSPTATLMDGRDPHGSVWSLQNLQPLFSTWKQLEEIQLSHLTSSLSAPPLKPFAGKLKRLSLSHPDISDSDLYWLLKSSGDQLDTLDLHQPTSRLSRLGVARALVEHGAGLKSFQLDVKATWHPLPVSSSVFSSTVINSGTSGTQTAEVGSKSTYMIDSLIGHMPKLLELKLSGSLASTILFARLPKTLGVLALEDNPGVELAKVNKVLKKTKKLRNPKTGKTKTVPAVLPLLKCFTMSRRDGHFFPDRERDELSSILYSRKGCLHWSYSGRGGPAAFWPGVGVQDVGAHPFAAGIGGGGAPPPGGVPVGMPFPMPFDMLGGPVPVGGPEGDDGFFFGGFVDIPGPPLPGGGGPPPPQPGQGFAQAQGQAPGPAQGPMPMPPPPPGFPAFPPDMFQAFMNAGPPPGFGGMF